MLNTFGLFSINFHTFNKWHKDFEIPKGDRKMLVALLRIHNLILNSLGYLPKISPYSPLIRVTIGSMFLCVALLKGNHEKYASEKKDSLHTPKNSSLSYWLERPWYQETLLTALSQIARGFLEIYSRSQHCHKNWPVSFQGRLISPLLIIDILSTLYNIEINSGENPYQYPNNKKKDSASTYQDDTYRGIFKILNLV